MDDKGTPCTATDCASTDSEMRTNDEGFFADLTTPAEVAPSMPPEWGEDPPISTGDPAAIADECASSAPDPSDQVEDPQALLDRQVIEALLFSSDAPLSAARLADLVDGCTPGLVRKHIAALNEKYEQVGLSFRIEAIARGYRMLTLADFRCWIAKLEKHHRQTRLSAAALETLSVIAYKQPVIRAGVEAIRGVACGEVISRLREMGVVRVLGRAEIVGRPLLYGTTKKFLDVFGLADLDDLPPMEALQFKSASKPVEEVEPVKPAPIPAPPAEQMAAIEA